MELQFEKTRIPCLKPVMRQVQNLEQTQELRIPEGMPGAAEILGCWGQAVLRSKEWDADTLSATGGVMVWVLYAPEDGGEPRKLESWVPFQTRWDLPADWHEGHARVICMLRFADARTVTPGKLMLRVGIGMLAEGWTSEECYFYKCPEESGNVELLRRSYPLRLRREAGEKPFRIEEELTLPTSAPQPDKILYYQLNPQVGELKVLGGRLVFRGCADLHLMYHSEEGKIHTWDFEIPFSQFADLQEQLSQEARGDIQITATNLELDLDDEGKLNLKAAMTAQYLLDDRQMVQIAEDGYCPGKELELRTESVSLPILLESRQNMLRLQIPLPEEAAEVTDVCVLRDFPRLRMNEGSVTVELSGVCYILYCSDKGNLQSRMHRWEGKCELPSDQKDALEAMSAGIVRLHTGQGSIIEGEIPVEITASVQQEFTMIREASPGGEIQRLPDRPSLILCRATGNSLWELAKRSGSAMDAIRSANGLEGDPTPNQILLVPVL